MSERSEVGRAFRVSGRVQGVGFRWWTRRVAQELGLVGSVRNLPDGSVEVQARGGEGELERFEARLWDGPAGARVDGLESIAIRVGTVSGFQIEA